jgi:hypothetical protein
MLNQGAHSDLISKRKRHMTAEERIAAVLALPEAAMLGPEYSGKGKQHLCIVTGLNGKPRKPTAHASVHQALRDLGIDARGNGLDTWPGNWLINERKSLKLGQSTTIQTPDGTLIEMRLVFSTPSSRHLSNPVISRAVK